MTCALAVAEVVDGVVSPTMAETVRAAADVGGEVVVAVVAADAEAVAAQIGLAGVREVVAVDGVSSDRDHEQMQQVVATLIAEVVPDVILAPFSIRSSSWGPALAHQLDLAFVPDVIALGAQGDVLTATRSVYAGRVRAEYELACDRPALVLVRPGAWRSAEAGTPSRVRTLEVELEPSRVRSVEVRRPSGDLDLAGSDVILAIGRGVGSRENIDTFAEIARGLGAALAATRPVVDAGWLPSAHQVGQTGTTVRPKLYIALGISGAIQHLSGMQDSKTIMAVNSDKNAPIFGFADVGAVADMHEVAERLQALLAERGPAISRSEL